MSAMSSGGSPTEEGTASSMPKQYVNYASKIKELQEELREANLHLEKANATIKRKLDELQFSLAESASSSKPTGVEDVGQQLELKRRQYEELQRKYYYACYHVVKLRHRLKQLQGADAADLSSSPSSDDQREAEAAYSTIPQMPPELSRLEEIQVEQVIKQVARALDTPLQTMNKILDRLLEEPNALGHQEVAMVLALKKALLSKDVYSLEVERLEKEASIDEMTRDWLEAEFANRGPLFAALKQHTLPLGSPSPSPSAPPEGDALQKILTQEVNRELLLRWDFPVWDFDDDQLFGYFMAMFDDLGLLTRYDIPREKLYALWREVRARYRENPYHNFQHAFDVTHTVYRFLKEPTIGECLVDLDRLVLLTAAISHDVGHPGTNNAFQINTQSPLALRYNDQSVLENFHCSLMFELLNDPRCNILAKLTPKEFQQFRASAIAAVLQTDMALHFPLVAKFETHTTVASGRSPAFNRDDPGERQLLVNMLLHAADISNVFKPWEASKRWADYVFEEFLRQGDLERDRGMPISPWYDRYNTSQPKMLIGFMNFMVGPMLTVMYKAFPALQSCVECLEKNKAIWEQMRDQEEREKKEKDGAVST